MKDKKNFINLIVIIVVLVALVDSFLIGRKVKVEDNRLTVSSGVITPKTDISLDEIKDVYVKESIPSMKRNFGASMGKNKKGTFTDKELGKGKVYVTSKDKVFVYVIYDDSFSIIGAETQDKADELVAKLKK